MAELAGLSSPVVVLTIVVVLSGVGLKTWAGMIGKPARSLNPNMTIFTAIIASVSGIALVAPAVGNIPNDATGAELLVAIVGQILVVYGADSLYKRAAKSPAVNRRLPFLAGPRQAEYDVSASSWNATAPTWTAGSVAMPPQEDYDETNRIDEEDNDGDDSIPPGKEGESGRRTTTTTTTTTKTGGRK